MKTFVAINKQVCHCFILAFLFVLNSHDVRLPLPTHVTNFKNPSTFATYRAGTNRVCGRGVDKGTGM
jgi:hypothetical protein